MKRNNEGDVKVVCGIAGIVDQTACWLTPDRLKNMIDAGAHRGPDGDGLALFCRDRVELRKPARFIGDRPIESPIAGLAHRRLAILDLSENASQPMSDSSGRFWIVLNGEIYNYVELRRELEEKGHCFRTTSDTEVVLNAYLEWGSYALTRFNGMWAFAIFDRSSRELFCSRDRFGVKPLYYISKPGVFAFASEIKQLLSLNLQSLRINEKILADHFLWRYETHKNETFLHGIYSLPASTYIQMSMDVVKTGRVTPYIYWKPQISTRSSKIDVVGEFRDLLEDSVCLRLRSDVPVGVTLSGGLDSSSITCLAARCQRKKSTDLPLRVFTVVYPDPGYSEERYAAMVADACHARMTQVAPEETDLREDWRKFVWSMEEPFAGLSFYSNWKLYQAIRRQGIRVVLNGQGGDELLLGYDRYRVVNMISLWRQRRYVSVLREALRSRHNGNQNLVRQAMYMIYFGMPTIRARRRRSLVRPFLMREFYETHSARVQDLRRESLVANLSELQLNEFYRYQLPHLLRHEDRVSMASGVEARSPFLDYRLLEYVLSLGSETFFEDGWSKRILRDAMKTILPEPVRLRTDKMGFDTPTARIIHGNRQFFIDLLHQHRKDPYVCVDVIERGVMSGSMNEYLSCSILSYLTWKDIIGISH